MKINTINTIPFKKQIRIQLSDKSMNSGSREEKPMNKILAIASKNKTGIFVGKDIFILKSNDTIKADLEKEKIPFDEVEDTISYEG